MKLDALKKSLQERMELLGAYSYHDQCEQLLRSNVGMACHIVPLGRMKIDGPCTYIPLVEYGVAIVVRGITSGKINS